MKLRRSIAAILFLFLLSTPCFSSKGGSESGMDAGEVYEIDYRGPETHSSHLSPPDHSHRRPKSFRVPPKATKAVKINP